MTTEGTPNEVETGGSAAGTSPAPSDSDLTTQAVQINEFVAREGQARLDAIGSEIAAAAGGQWQGMPKSVKSLVEKVTRKQRMGRSDYDIYSPKDHARGTITVARWDDVPTVLELLREQGFAVEVTVDQPLNQFGYRGINTTVALGDRINGEIQIHTEESWAVKKQTDDLYRKWRDDIEAVTNAQTLPPEKFAEMKADIETSKRLWENYWANVSAGVKSAISSLDSGRASMMAASETPAAGPQTPSVSTSNRDNSSLARTSRPSGNRDSKASLISESVPQDPGSVKPDSGKLAGGRQAGGTILFSSDEWRRLVAEGRRLFSEGADQFAAWSEAMVTATGEEIRPALRQLWQLAVNPAVEPKQEKTWERVNPQEAAASSLAEIQQSLEHLTYEALKTKAREIGVAVRGKKAQLAALIAEAIKAKAGPEVRRMAQRTVRARSGPQKGQKIKRQVQVVTTRIADSKALRDTEKQIREHPAYQIYAESAGYIEKGGLVESRAGRVDPDKVYFVEPEYKGEVEGGQSPGPQGVRAARRICLPEFPGGLSTGETTEDDDLAAGKSRSQ